MTDITSKLEATLANVTDSLRAFGERAVRDGELNASARSKVDELFATVGNLSAEVQAARQRVAELEGNGAGGDVQHVSVGDLFVASEQFQASAGRWNDRSARATMNIKAALNTASTDAAGSAGALTTPNRLPGFITQPDARLTVRDLIGSGRTDSALIEYVQETGFVNNAAIVAEGALKPESSLKFAKKTDTTHVIAHTMKATRQILSDAPQLASYMNNRLIRGLKVKEDAEILRGTGANDGLLGLIPQATTYAAPTTIAGATRVDQLRLAMLQASLAEYPASGIVINPIDWAAIELAKDANNQYLIGNARGTLTPTLWGLPVVATQAMAPGEFLVGAFDLAAQIFDQWDARVEIGYVNDDFQRNMVTVLAEERLALVVYRPEALISGSFA
ncbi:9R [Xanthomonas phage Xp10]|uniref:9R n=1 Tax=Xanthomonas phage Xp10 TaxID=2907956 RepID=Q7Y5K8_9CAUD|nr:major head protein [Xanthomonas phage Xp10]AAP58676.1 9R [Xanthomonas phage Xp10]